MGTIANTVKISSNNFTKSSKILKNCVADLTKQNGPILQSLPITAPSSITAEE